MGLKKMKTVPCDITKDKIIVLCYIDDFLLFTEREGLTLETLNRLNTKHRVKDLGEPTQFLDLNLTWNNYASKTMRQEKLIIKLLQDIGIEQSKPVGSPIDESEVASKADSETMRKDQHPMYRGIARSLVYVATGTRPEYAVATSILAQ